jgi:hypothetical protein
MLEMGSASGDSSVFRGRSRKKLESRERDDANPEAHEFGAACDERITLKLCDGQVPSSSRACERTEFGATT